MRILWLLPLLLPTLAAAQQPAQMGEAVEPPVAIVADRPTAKPAPPETVGSLIPPDPDAAGQPLLTDDSQQLPSAPVVPAGPPVPETLRESAFDLSACHLALHLLGARYTVEPQLTDEDRDCGIAQPVRVTEALPGFTLEGGAAMRCDTALSLGLWLRDEVLPAAARLPAAPHPISATLGSTYNCRARVGDSGEKRMSEHAFGNAIDIAAFTFDNGVTLPIGSPDENDLTFAFLKTIHSAACLYFTTVLGPGSNAAHDGHLHLDTIRRSGGYRLCE